MSNGGCYRVAFFVMLGAFVGQCHRANMAEYKLRQNLTEFRKHLDSYTIMIEDLIAEEQKKTLKRFSDLLTTEDADYTDGGSRTGTDLGTTEVEGLNE